MKKYTVLTNIKKRTIPIGVYAKGSVYTDDDVPEVIKVEGTKYPESGMVEVTEVEDDGTVETKIPNKAGIKVATVSKGKEGTKQTPPKSLSAQKPGLKKKGK